METDNDEFTPKPHTTKSSNNTATDIIICPNPTTVIDEWLCNINDASTNISLRNSDSVNKTSVGTMETNNGKFTLKLHPTKPSNTTATDITV